MVKYRRTDKASYAQRCEAASKTNPIYLLPIGSPSRIGGDSRRRIVICASLDVSTGSAASYRSAGRARHVGGFGEQFLDVAGALFSVFLPLLDLTHLRDQRLEVEDGENGKRK